ncbi:2'-5' RNA ligase [Rhodovulum sp. P5]|uniref:RNA 2',3'-cyclic phosphodiesterase n=1 Tax=Rhodovulum sp. P5 TaxID=1564506 RepID=UPI0009C30C26|nr:RNA 2',3'-cyclic phosphodiesterase [Rhodovulum sp. P5]ARE41068.1 2'-5' RNA ligase [Rhodovulum sp. P5]
MIRAFAAIALPDSVLDALACAQAELPVSRPTPEDNLHLTLVFLGDVPEVSLEEVHLAFSAIRAAPFELVLSGMGVFGGRKPRLVYAGVDHSDPLIHLQAKLDRAARSAGIEVERRRFTPHVTLAYLNAKRDDPLRIERAVAAQAGFRTAPFRVEGFGLYQSELGKGGARYRELAYYAFSPSESAVPKA